MENFLLANRDFRHSPTLSLRYDRIQRDVTLRQQILLALTQSYENLRVREFRNTPVLTIVDSPKAPVRPNARRLVLKAILGILVGFTIAVLYVFLATSLQRLMEQGDPHAQRLVHAASRARGYVMARLRRSRPPASGDGVAP